MSEVETGKKCPNCGAGGRHDGEHQTAVRNCKLPDQTIIDVGWRCWNCGYEWGFEVLKGQEQSEAAL